VDGYPRPINTYKELKTVSVSSWPWP